MMNELILASSSPRRDDLLTTARINHQIIVPDIDETPREGELPQALVQRLAFEKAYEVSKNYPDNFVVGGDTTVVVDGKIFGKPTSKSEAEEMLNCIQGRSHQVMSAFCLLHKGKAVKEENLDIVEVEFYPMSVDEIRWYVETQEPMDKAGAYAAQGIGMRFVSRISGSYSGLIGLNVSILLKRLTQYGYK